MREATQQLGHRVGRGWQEEDRIHRKPSVRAAIGDEYDTHYIILGGERVVNDVAPRFRGKSVELCE